MTEEGLVSGESAMHTTVSVVTYERPMYVDRLLEALLRQTSQPNEVIVVNNGACEETRHVVESRMDRYDRDSIALRHHPRPDGTSLQRGRNDAIERANGDVICFVDDDTVPQETWLRAIERGYELDIAPAAVGGPALITDEDLTIQDEIIRSASNQNHLNRYGEHEQITNKWIPPKPVETDFLVGANMSFKIDVIEALGGFDPAYTGHPQFEELDVMARLWKREKTIVYHPDALVYHINASQEESERVSYWYGRNSLRYRRKNFPETYPYALLRLLINPAYGYPIWHQLGTAILYGNDTSKWRLRGYADELIFDRLDGPVSSQLRSAYAST